MTDIEKTIKGLEWILEGDRFGFGVNWDTDSEPQSEEEQAGVNIQNAIATLKGQQEEIENLKQTAQSMMEGVCLMKEQEAVKPTWGRGRPFCGACGLQIRGGKFCSECGRPIAWEGR